MKYINDDTKGNYIGKTHQEKVQALLVDGAEIIKTPTEWRANLVCVVNNGSFAAAAHPETPGEFNRCNYPNDPRPRTWLYYPHVQTQAK